MRVACVFVLAACTTHDKPPELSAVADDLAVEMNTAADLEVLDNDVGVADNRTLDITTAPMHGTAKLDDAGTLHYEPAADYLGDDTVEYQITNPDGASAIGTVAVKVGCRTCAIGGHLTLTWDPNAPGDNVIGYRIYSGDTMDPMMFAMVDDIMVTKPGFDPAMPSVTYDSWQDLHLRIGNQVCFALTAYNSAGESAFSNVACATVTAGAMHFGL